MSRIDDYLKTVDEVIEKGRFKDNWESLSRFKTPSFLREGRFGIFIHRAFIPFPLSAMNGIRAECISKAISAIRTI